MIVLAEQVTGRRKKGDSRRAKYDAYASARGIGKLGGSDAWKKVERSQE